jgi:hypothetical protein
MPSSLARRRSAVAPVLSPSAFTVRAFRGIHILRFRSILRRPNVLTICMDAAEVKTNMGEEFSSAVVLSEYQKLAGPHTKPLFIQLFIFAISKSSSWYRSRLFYGNDSGSPWAVHLFPQHTGCDTVVPSQRGGENLQILGERRRPLSSRSAWRKTKWMPPSNRYVFAR